jgi:hypothetical protein
LPQNGSPSQELGSERLEGENPRYSRSGRVLRKAAGVALEACRSKSSPSEEEEQAAAKRKEKGKSEVIHSDRKDTVSKVKPVRVFADLGKEVCPSITCIDC